MGVRASVAGAGVAIAIVASAVAPVAQAPAAPQFRAGVDIVIVEATVLDKSGALLPGLGTADFAVEIGGRRREVVSVELARHDTAAPDARRLEPDVTTNVLSATGRTILLAVDQESLHVEHRSLLLAASRWIDGLGPGDRVGLVTLPLPGKNVEFTTEHQRVKYVLDRLVPLAKAAPLFSRFNIGIWEAFRIRDRDEFVTKEVTSRECRNDPSPVCPKDVVVYADVRTTEAQAAVVSAIGSLRALMKGMNVLPGPKHVVLLTAGWPMLEKDLATQLTDVAAQAALANVFVHSFTGEETEMAAAKRLPSPTPAQDRALLAGNVEMLAGMTGGRSTRIVARGDLAFTALTQALSGYYRIGVRAQPEELDGKPHPIGVKVLRAGAKLAGYRRIVAANARVPVAADPTAALRDALESTTPVTGLELRATSYVLHGTDAASRALRVVVVGDVSGASAGPASAVAAIYTLDGRNVTAMENAVAIPGAGPAPLSIALNVPPGPYILRLAVRDVDGHLGSLERPVDARWRRVSGVESPGLVLLRGDGAGGVLKPLFRTVSAGERVIAQVPLIAPAGQKPQVTFEARAEDGLGPAFHQIGRLGTTSTGVMVAEATVPVGALVPGRYTLTATITPGATVAFGRSFVVEPVSAPGQ
jgi:VWFA-related protein